MHASISHPLPGDGAGRPVVAMLRRGAELRLRPDGARPERIDAGGRLPADRHCSAAGAAGTPFTTRSPSP